jgi:chorismate lyase/3-hydroxybenzoate synthase
MLAVTGNQTRQTGHRIPIGQYLVQTKLKDMLPGEIAASNDGPERLAIRIGETYAPPSPRHQLLLGFEFGEINGQPQHAAALQVALRPLTHERLVEAWWYRGKVNYTQSGPVNVAECDEYTVAVFNQPLDQALGIRQQSYEAYRELIGAIRATKHARMVKIWNYFDEINKGEGDEEIYRQFSIGRAEAFQEMGIFDEESPTGTAIGTHDGGALVLVAVASDHHYCPVENPRQTSAFRYPRQYGPKSPKFSRGGFVSSDSHQLYVISGTAAVVGHESNFPYDTPLQTNETIKNLEHLCEAISSMERVEKQFFLDQESVLRVYLKNPDDYPLVSAKLGRHFERGFNNIAYLHGTICRRELTVEIDGVKVVAYQGR